MVTTPHATDTVIATRALTKTFRDFWLREKVTAVRDLDLEIRSGEVYGLLGPNGSGKSTALKLILGLMFPTRGRVQVFGAPATHVPTKARIGFLPEESYLYPFLDARETLDYYGRLFKLPRLVRRKRIETLLEMVGLTGMAHRPMAEYSKGMQRRIGMAQALINDPDLLILDEPTSGMDPLGTRLVKDLIKEMASRGKTILLSSHLLADMEDVCTRVGILYAGQLRSEGTLEEMLARRSLTQITVERLEGDDVARLRDLLADRRVLAVETPKERLEALFLRIVREARAQKTAAAAVETGELADFLRAPQPLRPAQVIQELMAPPEPAPEEAAAAAGAEAAGTPPPPIDTRREVVEQLMGDRQEPPAPPPEPAGAPAAAGDQKPPAGPDVDRGVIEELLSGGDEEKPPDA